jgi:hypothetical protein
MALDQNENIMKSYIYENSRSSKSVDGDTWLFTVSVGGRGANGSEGHFLVGRAWVSEW